MLSVAELVADLGFPLLAGGASADAPVRWVHISELPDPTPWLSGGEVLLTTGMALQDEAAQRRFVASLATHGIAGLGVGTGFSHAEVPPAMVQEAEEHELPLFAVPYATPFIAVTERAFATLVNDQYAVLQRSIAAQERLQRIVLSERGLDAITGALATLIGGAAVVYDGRGHPQARRTFRRPLDPDVVEAVGLALRERARRGEDRAFVPEAGDVGSRALALPVGDAVGAVPQAWLVAVKDAGALTEFDRLVLHQAVTVVALELLRGRVAGTTERRLAGDLLSEVVAGELQGVELARRLEPFGLGGRVTALVLRVPARAGTAAVEDALEAALRAEAVVGLVAASGPLVCALMPGYADDELADVGERIHARVTAATGRSLAAGAGRALPAGRAREAFHEARCALEARALGNADAGSRAGTRRNGNANGNGRAHADGPAHAPSPVATFRDLGSFQLLLRLQDHDALRQFCASVLGPIEDGEGHYGGELVRSLEVFIEANGQWETAARQLPCHRHTLRYRVRKIEELTGRDLSSARDRIEFWLALRGRDLVPTPAGTPGGRR